MPDPDRRLGDRAWRSQANALRSWEDNDELSPKAAGEAFKRGIKCAELVVIPKAVHLVGHEQPAAVLQALARLG